MTTPAELLDLLSRPHVAQGWMAEIAYPSGTRRYHDGWGTITSAGKDWEGVNDPRGSQIISISSLRKPKFGQAPYVDIGIAAATPDFIRSYYVSADSYEGVACDIYYRVIDQETGAELLAPYLIFPGRLSAGNLRRTGKDYRTLSFKVVAITEGLNFPGIYGDWSPAGQYARYPGDLGLDLMESNVIETWKP